MPSEHKDYVALLTQVGEEPPVATVLNSSDPNYLGDITWTRNGVGDYTGTLQGAFTENKTFLIAGSVGAGNIPFFWLNVDSIAINVRNLSDIGVEDYMLEKTAFEVRVYI